ncbi:MAG: hypothetical protein ABIS50_21135 [Luteolibacter sp.]|uniref:hypothetical protein n=1 Tax=Luteolibacter sp. TaxID=1962973 RepID=UPI003264657C
MNKVEIELLAVLAREEAEEAKKPPVQSFSEFLETTPPNTLGRVSDSIKMLPVPKEGGLSPFLATPEIWLHCNNEKCGGLRSFRSLKPTLPLTLEIENQVNTVYLCSNCKTEKKLFSLALSLGKDKNEVSYVIKVGEFPAFGPPTPRKFLDLIDADKEAFLKGRRCETQGLGIGAFSYYRRVVENQKSRILAKILQVAELVNSEGTHIAALKNAIAETQFEKSIRGVKDAIPQSLLIKGHNPLTVLHDKLSDGLHGRTDEECLEIAQSVRIILIELCDRINNALKDDKEITHALSTLFRKKQPSAGESST